MRSILLVCQMHVGKKTSGDVNSETDMLNLCKLQRANIHGTQKLLASEEVRRDTTLGTRKLYCSLMVEGK